MLDLPELSEEVSAKGMIAMIRTKDLKQIAEELLYKHRNRNSIVAEMMNSGNENSTVSWLAARAMKRLYTEEAQGKQALNDIYSKMVDDSLADQIDEVSHQIRLAKASGDDMEVFKLQRQRTELEKQLTKASRSFDKDNMSD